MNFPYLRPVLRQTIVSLNNVYAKRFLYCAAPLKILENSLMNNGIRLVSTYEVKNIQNDENFIKKLLKKFPIFNVDRVKVRASAFLMYENIADRVNYFDFFEKHNIPDTFYSWFVITELHIWILSARAMADGENGKFFRNCLVEALWNDVAQRVKKLGAGNPSATRAQVKELSEQLQASLIAYDEGLQSDDIVLAGALWRRLYQMEYAPPHHLEELVQYIRKHVAIFDNLTFEQILSVKPVRWEPM